MKRARTNRFGYASAVVTPAWFSPGLVGTLRGYGYVVWFCTIGPAANDEDA